MNAKASLLLALLLPSLTWADQKKAQTWTDPAVALKENPDFSIQGEYHRKASPIGAQMVALGNGKFDLYVLEGGLPGLGWDKEKSRIKLTGNHEEGVVTFAANKGISALLEEKVLAIQRDGKDLVKVSRVERTSPTIGGESTQGCDRSFRRHKCRTLGKGSDERRSPASHRHHQQTEVQRLPTPPRIPHPPTSPSHAANNVATAASTLGGRWETQVLDSFALDGKMNECGGIYSISEPDVNMCLPPLTWQTYDVDFTSAKFDANGKRTAWPRMTVKLNGVIIHNDRELPKDLTTAAPGKGPLKDEALPVYLQNHGNPVVFRNIWVLPKP